MNSQGITKPFRLTVGELKAGHAHKITSFRNPDRKKAENERSRQKTKKLEIQIQFCRSELHIHSECVKISELQKFSSDIYEGLIPIKVKTIKEKLPRLEKQLWRLCRPRTGKSVIVFRVYDF